MNHLYKPLLLFLIFIAPKIFAQPDTYILNGSAQRNSCNCYTLTTEAMFESGSVWNKNKINLNTPFDFWFNVNLGCKDADGADGIVFMLQPISTSVGTSGEGMGFSGVAPSIGISLDTWQNFNLNDPYYDHISIQANGVVAHGNDLAPPVPISATSDNVEDCQWHILRIVWNPVAKRLQAYFDGSLRVEAQVDLVANIFNNDPNVYWGFTGATGGSVNLQQFCTALNPKFTTNLPGNSACERATVIFTDSSQSFAPITNYFWSFGDGTTSTAVNPAPHLYNQPGLYNVKMAITGKDGCNSDTLTKTIAIGTVPTADFKVPDDCYKSFIRVADVSVNSVGTINQWKWTANGNATDTAQQPHFNNLLPGNNELSLIVTSEYGCVSKPVTKMVTLKEAPKIETAVNNGCANILMPFAASQTDNRTTILQWNWNFGDGSTAAGQNASHLYKQPSDYAVQAWAVASNGCPSDTVSKTITVNQSYAFAGNDTIVLKGVPFQLNGSGQGQFLWSPPTGLDNDAIANPTATLTDDQQYELTVSTLEGCVAKDTINIKVFKGSSVYVPNAFTPDGNGLNDVIKPVCSGIKKLDFFTIFNRWGQKIFSTTVLNQGWDGAINGQTAASGTYIWMLKATDLAGKVYQLKGTVTLIR